MADDSTARAPLPGTSQDSKARGPLGTPDASTARALLDAPWAFWGLLLGATLLGAAIRLTGLERPSFWVDEFYTIARAGIEPLHWTQSFGYLPTRFTLWLDGAELGRIYLANISEWPALGVSEAAARLGPCWVGILSLPLLGLLARPVVGGGAAGVAVLLLAITPWHLYWSQMARFYTTQFLFANAFVLLFARALQTGRSGYFACASLAALLAFLAHPTTVFVLIAVGLPVGAAWAARLAVPHLATGLRWLALVAVVCGALLVAKNTARIDQPVIGPPDAAAAVEQEAEPQTASWLVDFGTQTWSPGLPILVLGTALRIEPVVVTAGLAWIFVAVRRREPGMVLLSGVAALVPLTLLALEPLVPIAPRYYFPCLFAWTLLAGSWAVEVDRRLAAGGPLLLRASGVLVLVAAIGFNASLYARDGAGQRARWREAYGYVLAHGSQHDVVLRKGPGDFQARYYLGRQAASLRQGGDLRALAPGTWVIQRTRGSRGPAHPELFEVKARLAIPSKPWSWVLYVLRVPDP